MCFARSLRKMGIEDLLEDGYQECSSMLQLLLSAGPLTKLSNHSFMMSMARLEEDHTQHSAAVLSVRHTRLVREISVCILIGFHAIMLSDLLSSFRKFCILNLF